MDILSFLPAFGGIASTLVAFVVALSIIVAVHEYGHYIVARWCGIRSEVFSIGFGPVLAARMDRRGTRWQIAALPLGGYVRFAGDGDAASARASGEMAGLSAEEARHTFPGAPLWARAATVAAGPLFNFVLAIAVFAGVHLFEGRAIEPPTVGTLVALPAAANEGLRPGDRILALEGQKTPDYAAFYAAIATLDPAAEGAVRYTVEREGRPREIAGPYPFPPVVASVQAGMPAARAGLAEGDVIIAANGAPVRSFAALQERILASQGAPVVLRYWRAGEIGEVSLAAQSADVPLPEGGFEQRWLIGMTGGLAFEPATATPGVAGAIGYGFDQTGAIIASSLSGVWHMVTGAISSCNLQGPIGIAQISGQAAEQGAMSFIWMIAVLSTAIGLVNLFPIPVLDGGHLVFHAYEALMRRPPSEAAMGLLTRVGFGLLLTLMGFALLNDILCP